MVAIGRSGRLTHSHSNSSFYGATYYQDLPGAASTDVIVEKLGLTSLKVRVGARARTRVGVGVRVRVRAQPQT